MLSQNSLILASFLKNGDLFTPSKTLKIEKTALNLSVFSAFIIEHSLVDKYNFQSKIIGYFLVEKCEQPVPHLWWEI